MSMVKKILFYSRDPGGTNCVIPVYQGLRELKGVESLLWGKDYAIQKYQEEGLMYRDVGDLKPEEIHGLLRQYNPKVLITGTSYGDRTEQRLWKWAKELGTYSMAILDQWLSYRVRFSDRSGRLTLPDKILVMDEFAKQEMVVEGFDQRRILVTGQPHFEALQEKAKKITTLDKKKIKKDLNLQNGIIVLFVSEPLSNALHVDIGFTEHTILRELISTVQQIKPSVTVNVLVKLHPKEDVSLMKKTIGSFPVVPNIRVSIVSGQPLLPLILITDIVIGMQSTVLIEANLLKKPVMSIQIGRKGPDQFILSKRGIVEAITARDVLKQELRRFLLHEGKGSQKMLPVIPHPIENVKRFIIPVFGQK